MDNWLAMEDEHKRKKHPNLASHLANLLNR